MNINGSAWKDMCRHSRIESNEDIRFGVELARRRDLSNSSDVSSHARGVYKPTPSMADPLREVRKKAESS